MREPMTAGTYYDRDPTLLQEEIIAHYEGARGPGALALNRITRNIKAVISPDSPYAHCGDCMAWAYKAVAESPTPDVYIIIATNHHTQEAGLSLETFNTPLGMVRVDQELAQAVLRKGTIEVNEQAHARDHAIEVQLPFLLHAKRSDEERIKILPILLSIEVNLHELAIDIKEALVELKRTAVFIISSDLTHYGPVFHYVPFTSDIPQRIYELDNKMLEFTKAFDPDGLARFVDEQYMIPGGRLAIQLLLRILKPCAVMVEQHYTSGDVVADYKNSVSYAAVVFEEKETKETPAVREI